MVSGHKSDYNSQNTICFIWRNMNMTWFFNPHSHSRIGRVHRNHAIHWMKFQNMDLIYVRTQVTKAKDGWISLCPDTSQNRKIRQLCLMDKFVLYTVKRRTKVLAYLHRKLKSKRQETWRLEVSTDSQKSPLTIHCHLMKRRWLSNCHKLSSHSCPQVRARFLNTNKKSNFSTHCWTNMDDYADFGLKTKNSL